MFNAWTKEVSAGFPSQSLPSVVLKCSLALCRLILIVSVFSPSSCLTDLQSQKSEPEALILVRDVTDTLAITVRQA